jgi:hypothetical protein
MTNCEDIINALKMIRMFAFSFVGGIVPFVGDGMYE